MLPTTLLLESTETVSAAAAKLHRARLEAVPVVDHHGHLRGILLAQDVAAMNDSHETDDRSVQAVMTAGGVRVQEGTPVALVLQHFSNSQTSVVVVVRGDEPKGLITRRDLSEIMRPFTAESTAMGAPLPRRRRWPCLITRRFTTLGAVTFSATQVRKSGAHASVDYRSADA